MRFNIVGETLNDIGENQAKQKQKSNVVLVFPQHDAIHQHRNQPRGGFIESLINDFRSFGQRDCKRERYQFCNKWSSPNKAGSE